MAIIDTPIGRIGHDDSGVGTDRRPILFLHGVGSDRSVWRPQLDHFAGKRRVLAMDYPGYGDSAARPHATRDDFATAGWALLDALGIDQAHLCGLSLGGIVAMAMHHQAPQRTASLVIADSFAAHPHGRAIYERSVAASRAMPMRAVAEARVPMLVADAAGAGLRHQLVETMAAIDPDAFRAGSAAVWLADLREQAAGIAVPTLVIVGDEDDVTPPALSIELAGMIAGATVEVITNAGHLTNVEQPAAFNDLVGRMLSPLD